MPFARFVVELERASMNAMKRALAAIALLSSSNAYALDPPFGAPGQVVVSDVTNGAITWTGRETSGANDFSAAVSTGADYFVARGLSLGLDTSISYESARGYGSSDGETASVGAAFRVGADVPLGRFISLWPQGGVGFSWFERTSVFPSSSDVGVTLALYFPLLLHLRSHVFLGVGPAVTHSFFHATEIPLPSSDTEVTTVSVRTMLGGYFGGEPEPHSDDLPVHWRAFGEPRELAFDLAASSGWSGESNGQPWEAWFTASGGVDYFAFRHFSAGGFASASYSRYEDGTSSDETWSFTLGPRIGYDIPLSARFSFYPRGVLGFGVTHSTSSTALLVWVGAYAPILCHFAPHAFLGLGPTISRELVDQDPTYPSSGDLATRVGALLSFGGWL